MWAEDIKTRFVRDRIAETPWERRGYVRDLHLIERLIAGESLGWAFHAQRGPERLYDSYPSEAECIRLEIEENRYIDPEDFIVDHDAFAARWEDRQRAEAEWRASRQAFEGRLRAEEREAELREERTAWLKAGGLP